MARKIKKVRPSLLRVFSLLLVPWVVMAVVAVAAFAVGAPDYLAIVLALVAALAMTFYIGNYVIGRRTTK